MLSRRKCNRKIGRKKKKKKTNLNLEEATEVKQYLGRERQHKTRFFARTWQREVSGGVRRPYGNQRLRWERATTEKHLWKRAERENSGGMMKSGRVSRRTNR